MLVPATIHGAQRRTRVRARVICTTDPLFGAGAPIAWRSASSTTERCLPGASSTLPCVDRITVATSSSARSSADIAGGVRPDSVLSTSSANRRACASSAAVGSVSGSGTAPVRVSSSCVAIRYLRPSGVSERTLFAALAKLLAECAYGAEEKDVERTDRDPEPPGAVFAR